jgi:hypothetical protein
MRTWFRRCSTLTGLALAAIALTATSASAQKKTEAGFLGGASFSTLTGTDSDVSPKSSTGFGGGFFVTIPVAKSVSIEPEILYINKGAGFEDEEFTLNLNYVEIPVLLRYEFTPAGGPFAYIGPYIGINVKCDTSVDTVSVPCKDDGVETNTTFGGTVGVGYRKAAWGFDIRYDYGFTDALKEFKGKNSALMILLRLAIN